jgi:putative hydrolase of the HAD superfamily
MVLALQKGGNVVIKAVFFDLFQTLVCYDPPRENVVAEILEDFDIHRNPEAFSLPLVAADEFMYGEISRRPLSQRSKEELTGLYIEHVRIMLREAGIDADETLARKLLGRMRQIKMKLVLFEDVAPALKDLKDRGLILGLISNVEEDITNTLTGLGLTSWLSIIVTSMDAGVNKPRPEIFRYALKQAGVQPEESIYVGDQYQVDILGSRSAGIKGILIDRLDYNKEITDCPRIRRLTALTEHLE